MTAPAAGSERRAELAPLVAWAARAARVRARLDNLSEAELVSAAMRAVVGALRTHRPDGGATLADHVRRRVRGALLRAGAIERRRRQREALLDDLEEALPPGIERDAEALSRVAGLDTELVGSPEDAYLALEAQAALRRQVETLPRADRRLYVLHFRDALTWDEASAATGIPAGTLRRHVKRIRDHLIGALRRHYGAG